jgi:solute carrier family 44 (choline transporter-like protein), member 1
MNSTEGSKLGAYIGDLYTCWWLFLAMLGISAAIAMLYMFLLRCFTKPLLYISFILILAILVASGIYVFISASNYTSGDKTYEIMRGMGILLWILAGIYFIILLCCCSRIRLGIAIMEATSSFVRMNLSVFFIPLVFFVIIGCWATFWVISAIYVYSVGTPTRSSSGPYADIIWDDTTRYVWIYHLFGLFWISAFIIGCA